MKKGSLVIRPVRVTVRFGAPIETAALTLDDRDALIAQRAHRGGGAVARSALTWNSRPRSGRTMGFSFAAGINLYATVAILGLASRYGWVALPPQFQVFDNNWVIGTRAGALRDRVRRRQDPVGRLGLGRGAHRHPAARRRRDRGRDARRESSATTETMVALLGGALAASTHFSKVGHARDGQREPGAVQQLGPQHRRRYLRRRPRLPGAEVSGGRRDRRDRRPGDHRRCPAWIIRAVQAPVHGQRRLRDQLAMNEPTARRYKSQNSTVDRTFVRFVLRVFCLLRIDKRVAPVSSPPVVNVSVTGVSGWLSTLLRMPSSRSTFTVRKRSSGAASLISSARLPSM